MPIKTKLKNFIIIKIIFVGKYYICFSKEFYFFKENLQKFKKLKIIY